MAGPQRSSRPAPPAAPTPRPPTELAPAAYVGTALSLQTSLGFLLTMVSTWLVPRAVEAWGWPWAFAFLAPGPFLGTLAMARLRRLPESAKLAQGRR